ncbi:hypothetical protein EVAR_32618_1 [Eumeta japonica]|uniref:Uncharacterized protein n=1 Tax=Eumeta variegata TaxID=151549 RepID=A0A4C1WH19_EUMVA|nr:hypothetical protein EVAR_32618_1 [Eumeta japonica]
MAWSEGRRAGRPPAAAHASGGRRRVRLYLKYGVDARQVAHPDCPGAEQMWLGLHLYGMKIAIGTSYRPPWQIIDTFLDALTDYVTTYITCLLLIV